VEPCKHMELEFLGSEKTDEGQNRYMKCKTCGSVIVVTAGGKVVAVAPVGSPREETDRRDARTHSE